MLPMNKLGKTDTRNLLRHATAHASTREVALFLGVSDTRISEGKSGKWQLSHEQAVKLYEEYGQPLAAAGLFTYAELWQSTDDFIDNFKSISEWRQYCRIKTVLFSDALKEYSSYLINSDNYDSLYRIESLLKLITDETFQDSINTSRSEYIRTADRYHSYNYIETKHIIDVLKLHNVEFMSGGDELYKKFWLDMLSVLYQEKIKHESNLEKPTGLGELLQEFSIGSTCVDSLSFLEKGLVITGDEVWNDSNQLNENFKEKCTGIINLTYEMRNGSSIGGYPPCDGDTTRSICSDYFVNFKISVYITKKLNYYFYIELEDKNKFDHFKSSMGRRIVIKNNNSLNVFNEIQKIYDFFNIKRIPLDLIKIRMAENGGYIPGAMYLE